MTIIIQKTTDKKYLQSFENDVWVENINDSYQMNYLEFLTIKENLLKSYNKEDLKEIFDFFKNKEMTKEEKKQIQNLFRSKN